MAPRNRRAAWICTNTESETCSSLLCMGTTLRAAGCPGDGHGDAAVQEREAQGCCWKELKARLGQKPPHPEASTEPRGGGCKNTTETSCPVQWFRTSLSITGALNQTHRRPNKNPPKLGKEQRWLHNPEVMIKPKLALTWVCE